MHFTHTHICGGGKMGFSKACAIRIKHGLIIYFYYGTMECVSCGTPMCSQWHLDSI